MHEVQRRRTRLGVSDEPCAICGRPGLELIESRRVRRGIDLSGRASSPPSARTGAAGRGTPRHDVES